MFKFITTFAKRIFQPQPFNVGYFQTTDGHAIYFEEYGVPDGVPVLSFHGGPGSRLNVRSATIFPLKKARVILFDQRGCGKSTPSGSLVNNTTSKILEDANALLDYLGIKNKVVVNGNSFGSTLALLFAEQSPERIQKVIVSSIFLARREDYIDWISTTSNFYPDFYEEVMAEVPAEELAQGNFYSHFTKLSQSQNREDQIKAAILCLGYEMILGLKEPKFKNSEDITERILISSKISNYFQANNFFIEENQILNNIDKIKHLEVFIAHNRLDMTCAVKQAYQLSQALPKSTLIIVPALGHGGKELVAEVKKWVSLNL
ncbi:MAG: alpha/beta fold hydrolase [Deltaproteobacteria bacterium]|jgi:proline iminopeptidase|nr:alpha/beta fold hydrolase [Deltaproteobacteria bacterium]